MDIYGITWDDMDRQHIRAEKSQIFCVFPAFHPSSFMDRLVHKYVCCRRGIKALLLILVCFFITFSFVFLNH